MIRSFFLLSVLPLLLFPQSRSSIVFLSDTQQPMWIETLRLPRHDNEQAARAIYRSVAQESTAAAIVHLGDITYAGMFTSAWEDFDAFRKNVAVPLVSVPGNHEYFFLSPFAMRQYRQRFPSDETWHTFVVKNVAVIVLNSNMSRLDDEENAEQRVWYEHLLKEYDADSSIAAVIVGCHHPPFTNSAIVDPSAEVREYFFGSFARSTKGILFLSGHAHTFEQFTEEGKTALVIGGGGGLQQPLLPEAERRFHSVASDVNGTFHYIVCHIEEQRLRVEVRTLTPQQSVVPSAHVIDLPFSVKGTP